jgi:hypothetical protein
VAMSLLFANTRIQRNQQTRGGMRRSRRIAIGVVSISMLLVAAWIASADVRPDASISNAALQHRTIESPEQPGSLLLLGFGLALAARSIKRQAS